MYCEYWGLKNPPFDNIPSPSIPANGNDPLTGPEGLRNYINARLNHAGASEEIFTEKACDALWRQSQNKLPSLVNRLAKLCLIVGEIYGLRKITGETVDGIASRLKTANAPALPERKPRPRAAKE